jgi:hypothetical protein
MWTRAGGARRGEKNEHEVKELASWKKISKECKMSELTIMWHGK